MGWVQNIFKKGTVPHSTYYRYIYILLMSVLTKMESQSVILERQQVEVGLPFFNYTWITDTVCLTDCATDSA